MWLPILEEGVYIVNQPKQRSTTFPKAPLLYYSKGALPVFPESYAIGSFSF
jgi:hypothetical protein